MDQNNYSNVYRRKLNKRTVVRSKSETFMVSFRTITKEYCKESSISGLKHLVEDNTPYIERVIWIITLIGALICSVSLVWMTFLQYYRSPLVTTQIPEGISVNKIIFPAVGICSNNRISRRAATDLAKKLLQEERNVKYNVTQMLSLLFGLGRLYNLHWIDTKPFDVLELHQALGNYEVNELMKNLTPKCEDLLLRCSWNENPINCSDLFDFRLTMNGYCCTFNYLRSSDITFEENDDTRKTDKYLYGNKSSFEYEHGLKILLQLDESDDFFYNIPLKGAQLQFSDAYDFPDAPSGSFSLHIICPHTHMTVFVTASVTEASRDIEHVPVKLRKCLFYDESSYLPFYTFSDCLLKCRMSFLMEKCNCTPFNMPKLRNTRTCDLRDVPCLTTFNAQSTTLRPDVEDVTPEQELNLVSGGIHCPMCYPTCSKTAYHYDYTNVYIYPDHLNELPVKDKIDWLHGANFTGTSIVHIKYASEVANCYGQNVIMKWFDLISNIGSTCGFVTGFSFVSVLEFVYFYTVKLIRDYVLRRRRERRVANGVSTPAQLDHITRYRSIYWNEISGPNVWLNNPD